MQVLTRTTKPSGWEKHQTIRQALVCISVSSDRKVLLFTDNPAQDLPSIRTFVDMAKLLGIAPDSIIAATPHPSGKWLAPLLEAGVSGFKLCSSAEYLESEIPTKPIGEVLNSICPELHSIFIERRTLSVCGDHHDHMVLSHNHLVAWCLGKYRDCPQRLPS